jgi:hypothetical protein
MFRFGLDAIVSITCDADGNIVARGERSDVVNMLNYHIHENLLLRGRTLSDALRVARKIEKEFGAEIVDLRTVLASIRNGWLRLLEAI